MVCARAAGTIAGSADVLPVRRVILDSCALFVNKQQIIAASSVDKRLCCLGWPDSCPWGRTRIRSQTATGPGPGSYRCCS